MHAQGKSCTLVNTNSVLLKNGREKASQTIHLEYQREGRKHCSILAVIIFCPRHFRLAFVYLWTEFDHIFTVEL